MPLHTGGDDDGRDDAFTYKEEMMSLHTGGDVFMSFTYRMRRCLYIQEETMSLHLHTGGDDVFTYRRRCLYIQSLHTGGDIQMPLHTRGDDVFTFTYKRR